MRKLNFTTHYIYVFRLIFHHIVPIQPRHHPATTNVNNTISCTYSLDAPDDERKYR